MTTTSNISMPIKKFYNTWSKTKLSRGAFEKLSRIALDSAIPTLSSSSCMKTWVGGNSWPTNNAPTHAIYLGLKTSIHNDNIVRNNLLVCCLFNKSSYWDSFGAVIFLVEPMVPSSTVELWHIPFINFVKSNLFILP